MWGLGFIISGVGSRIFSISCGEVLRGLAGVGCYEALDAAADRVGDVDAPLLRERLHLP